jgi:HK97 family phage major capsid protein
MVDINRSDVSTLIEEAYSHVFLEAAVAGSAALTALPNVNMGTKTTHLPVLATLPQAGWVTEGDAKPTSEIRWKDLTMVAEEIAVIIPVHENVIDDATVPILTDIARLGGQAIGKKLDEAVLWGRQKPASWTSAALYPAAVAAGQTNAYTAGAANADDLVGATMAVAKSLAIAGQNPDTVITSLALSWDLANIRDGNGAPIFNGSTLSGFNTTVSKNGGWDPSLAQLLVVDSSRVRIGVRQDITVKFLDQATVDGINLAERDMVALRFKARYAYVLSSGATNFTGAPVPVGAVINAGS